MAGEVSTVVMTHNAVNRQGFVVKDDPAVLNLYTVEIRTPDDRQVFMDIPGESLAQVSAIACTVYGGHGSIIVKEQNVR